MCHYNTKSASFSSSWVGIEKTLTNAGDRHNSGFMVLVVWALIAFTIWSGILWRLAPETLNTEHSSDMTSALKGSTKGNPNICNEQKI
mmetsp:Transcript_12366/g.19645  ORF Transcript_12366/g.19645 Transcript_12366/m.19645 type:complete len:88 (+) Transcript_12366:273-536(+)